MASMTDMNADKLNRLADKVWDTGIKWFFNYGALTSEEHKDIIAALRLAATMEEFGELHKKGWPTLWREYPSGKWFARPHIDIQVGPFPTPIEAMRAAIDAANPNHEHEYEWRRSNSTELLYNQTKKYVGCCACGACQYTDHLVPAS